MAKCPYKTAWKIIYEANQPIAEKLTSSLFEDENLNEYMSMAEDSMAIMRALDSMARRANQGAKR